MKKSLTDKVYDKLHNEFLNELDKIKYMKSEDIESNIYNILFKQEIVDMFKDRERYNKYELNAILKLDNSLDYLYNEWKKSDDDIIYSIEEDIEIQIEDGIEAVMSDLASDYITKAKKEMSKDKER